MKDTPFVTRAYNLGLKAVSNFVGLPEGVIEYYESHLDRIPSALLRGFIIEIETKTTSEPTLDFTIHVDRTVRPTYPSWMKKVMHPGLELTGSAKYDLYTIELWLHDDQKSGGVSGNIIYDFLKEDNDALANCLGLADLVAIQAKGIAVFRKLYSGKAVFAWKSVVESSGGRLCVPYLYVYGGKVVFNWRLLDSFWNFSRPAVRFSK